MRARSSAELWPLIARSAASSQRVSCLARVRPICRSCRSASFSLNGSTPACESALRSGNRCRWASAASMSSHRGGEPPQRRGHLRQQAVRLFAGRNQPIELRERVGRPAIGGRVDHVPRRARPPAADVLAHELHIDDAIRRRPTARTWRLPERGCRAPAARAPTARRPPPHRAALDARPLRAA